MHHILTKINKVFVKDTVIALGRWNIVYCDKIINKKLDLSNEDHCGSCTQYNASLLKNNDDKLAKSDPTKIIFYESM
jgi:hypothetical protein